MPPELWVCPYCPHVFANLSAVLHLPGVHSQKLQPLPSTSVHIYPCTSEKLIYSAHFTPQTARIHIFTVLYPITAFTVFSATVFSSGTAGVAVRLLQFLLTGGIRSTEVQTNYKSQTKLGRYIRIQNKRILN